MKKLVSAFIMGILSCCILFLWHTHLDKLPDFEDMPTFDPSGYECTTALQTFKLKAHDRHWFLSSFTSYDEDGEIISERRYTIAEDGHAYYMNGEKRMEVSRFPRKGFSNLGEIYSEWGAVPEVDEYGRTVHVVGDHPDIEELSYVVELYYRTDIVGLTGDASICAFVSTMSLTYQPGQNSHIIDEDGEQVMEYHGYTITNFDLYGNETTVMLEGPCCMKTDAEGFLSIIIQKSNHAYKVIRVDECGRPQWSATYSVDDCRLLGYSVWTYETIE